ncbi:uncharacterized protein LOC131302957 [Rhododendron vialii]|uniref:uncharacterized protein LOC131302957 n=1 Tax=Rhododendron vialii TaxID=182163 RepID=UPI00265F31B0|nr:uncharacterized protein LOC131302957 [Rhododendron vialii]
MAFRIGETLLFNSMCVSQPNAKIDVVLDPSFKNLRSILPSKTHDPSFLHALSKKSFLHARFSRAPSLSLSLSLSLSPSLSITHRPLDLLLSLDRSTLYHSDSHICPNDVFNNSTILPQKLAVKLGFGYGIEFERRLIEGYLLTLRVCVSVALHLCKWGFNGVHLCPQWCTRCLWHISLQQSGDIMACLLCGMETCGWVGSGSDLP